MEIAGYLASVGIGISLGLIGGGGSILTVPVLVYLFHLDAVLATSYSLFIVGTTSAFGSVGYFFQGLVNFRTAILFGIPSIVSVFMTRAFIVPAIPEELFAAGNLVVTKGIFLLVFFAVLMIVVAYSMIHKPRRVEPVLRGKQSFAYPMIIGEGLIVGCITGLVGAGGGFLIIPALVGLSKLPMKEAVGTSLVIIAAKSLIGFFGERGEVPVQWALLLSISAFAIAGTFIGGALSRRIDNDKLKPAFGWFVLVMGIFVIVREVLQK